MDTVRWIENLRRVTRAALPTSLYRRLHTAADWWSAARVMGVRDARRLRSLIEDRWPGSQPVEIAPRDLMHPIRVRPRTADAKALVHTVARRTYSKHGPRPPVRRIIDAGAYVGDTTAWYLSRYPEAMVVALEPDPANFAMARENLRAYGNRAVLLNVGLWHRPALLRVSPGAASVGIEVDEVPDGAPHDCRAVTVNSILDDHGWDCIDILKADIEGAERQVFDSGDCDRWLARTRCIVIETHGAECAAAVRRAVSRHPFVHHVHRELDYYCRSDI